ncbi:MAG: SIS domain-containing protein [Gemmatimonadota bacterium]
MDGRRSAGSRGLDPSGRSRVTAALERARDVIRTEAGAVARLEGRIGAPFARAVELVLACRGRVVVTGMGKSGVVARKVAATLASTGTPAVFLHPSDSAHGDAGVVLRGDVVLVISKSGETDELFPLLSSLKRLDLPIVALVGNPASTLARHADVALDVSVEREACPLDLAPTSSTAAAMSMGDALAVALFEARGLGPEDLARLHPAGALGRRLLLRVDDVMVPLEQAGRVDEAASMREAIVQMAARRGIVAVLDGEGRVVGVVTNGDLMRLMRAGDDVFGIPVARVMTREPEVCATDELAATAVHRMETRGIISMPAVESSGGRLVGMIHLHDCMRAGVV